MTPYLIPLLMLFAACGDGEGNDDTLLTGFSGFVILIIVIWAIVHFAKKRG